MTLQKEWLTLSEAAHLLGVHPTTLRRWTNNGDIPARITPGGHRRFSRSQLAAYVGQNEPGTRIGPGQIWGSYALTETRQRLTNQPEPRWLTLFDTDTREEHRALGRRLMGLLIQHISAPADNQDLLIEAKSIAGRYAQLCQRVELTAAEALEATTFFRDTMTEVAIQMPEVALLESETQLRLLRKINQIFNLVQVTVVEYYNSSRE